MNFFIHPKDVVHVLALLDCSTGKTAERIATDLRAQIEQNLLPVTYEVKERPRLRVIDGGKP